MASSHPIQGDSVEGETGQHGGPEQREEKIEHKSLQIGVPYLRLLPIKLPFGSARPGIRIS